MKRYSTLCSLLFVTLATALSLSAVPKVGVLLKGRTPFWAEVEAGAMAAAGKNGVEVIVKLPLVEDNIDMQVKLLNALASQGVEAIVISPNHPKALLQPLQAIAAKGIKIVVLDSQVEGSAWNFVGTNQVAAGEAAGALIASLVGDQDEVVIFKSSETQVGGATEQREKGAVDAIHKAKPGVSIVGNVFSGSLMDVALERAEVLISRHPKARLVYASGSAGTLAMLRKLEEKKKAGSLQLVGVGFNLNREVANAISAGHLQGWVAQLPRDVGAKAVDAAAQLIKGISVPAVVNTSFVVITKENLSQPAVQALILP